MNLLWFGIGFVTCYFFIELGKNVLIKSHFIQMEHKFLLAAINLLQYKFHAIELIKLVYDRAAEDDQKYLEEKKLVIAKIEEKYQSFGDEWVIRMKTIFPYNLNYNNWKEAIEYANKLFIKR
jgi:hypothetical protein